MGLQLKIVIFLITLYQSSQWCLLQTYYQLGNSVINEIDWSPDSSFLVTASASNRVNVLSFASSNTVFYDTFASAATTAKFNKAGTLLAVGITGDDTIKMYKVPGFTFHSSFRAGHGNTTTINQLDFSFDDTKLVTCGADGFVNQRTLSNGSIDWRTSLSANAISCKYSDSGTVGVSTTDGNMHLLKSNGLAWKIKALNKANDVDFRPGTDRYLYGGCTCDKKIYEYDTQSNNMNTLIDTTKDQVWGVSHATDQSFIAVGGKGGYFWVANTTNRPGSGSSFQASFRDRFVDINTVRVSDNNNLVAVAHVDGVILIYGKVCLSSCPIGHYFNAKTCKMCSIDIVGCAMCLNSTNCTVCYPQYYLNNNNVCVQCDNAINGCTTCKNSTVCYTCSQTYYLSGNTCAKCETLTPYCNLCSNTTCIACSYHYYLTSSNTCSDCRNSISACISCNLKFNSSSSTNYTLYCAQCSKGYYASNNQCLTCSNHCDRCLSTGVCIACAEQFKLNGTSCVKCGQYCQSCNDTGTCNQCIPTTFISSGSCSICSFPCLTCVTSSTTCLTCSLGYYMSGTNVCSKCIGCPLCNPYNGTCLSCPVGQYIQSPSNTCANCLNTTSRCAICSSSACLACQRNYYLGTGNVCMRTTTISQCLIYQKMSTTLCEHCNIGFYLDTNGTCSQCLKQCLSCDNSNNCTQCQVGYYMNTANATCLRCSGLCKTCNSSTQCLSCGDQYYLNGTTCSTCWGQIPHCNSCLDSLLCLNCIVGYQLTVNNTCIACVSPCATCNSTGCLSCQQGYFYASNNCTRCPSSCSSCASLTICYSCVAGYALDVNNTCVTCDTLFPNCQYCSYTACTVCKNYFMLNATSNSCTNCPNNITNCLNCDNSGLCYMCQYGFYPASNKLSCTNCTVTMPKCQSCVNASICDSCMNGYYLSSSNQCSRCISGCLTCRTAGTCSLCQAGFIKTTANICQACNQYIFGCQSCTLSAGCAICQLGYYKVSSTSCVLCKSTMDGCLACSSSTICVSCDAGYFLNSTNKCQVCSTTAGCSICNSTTCVDCLVGYFLNTTTNQCRLCSVIDGNCTVCNSTHCLQCDTGTYLSGAGCTNCTTFSAPCLVCNITICQQCQSGYYIQSNGNCQICNILGCQVCSPTGTTCLSCQNLYYKTGSTCSLCQSMNFGCLTCSSLNICLMCKTGYYLHTNNTCLLCSSKYPGCDICTSSKCLTCKTNYFYNTTSITGDCLICNSFLPGCSLCINQNQCLLCQSGYYLQGLQCHSCTTINQCMICQNANTCLFCGAGYYLNNGQCSSCSDAITGCFSCISANVCQTCSGSYTMSGGSCVQVKGVVPQNYTNIRIVSQYVNSTHLKHILYTTGVQFKQIQQNWDQVTKIALIIPPNNKTSLTIIGVQWGRVATSLIFYTNNPFGQVSGSKTPNNMPLVGNFANRRMLLTLEDLNMQVSFSMQKAAIAQILPQLDTSGLDLSLQYKINNPQFYRSVVANQKYYFYLFGIVVTGLLTFGYFIKICCVIPMTNDTGQIIPHIMLLKLPAMVIYPTLGGYINFCYGFTYIDLPWFNEFFSSILSNDSDQSPASYKMFYKNLSISSTYLLALSVFLSIFIPLTIYSIYKSYRNVKKRLPVERTRYGKIVNENISVLEKPVDRIEQFRSYFYNIFMTGLTVSSFGSIIGMSYNPTSVVSLEGAFYVLGIIIYTIILIDAIKSFMDQKHKFNKIRVVIKASLMTLLFWSPIPLFSVIIVVDGAIMAYEYKLKLKEWVVPKIWLLNQILLLASYGCLIFMVNMSLGIILSMVFTATAMAFDCYLQYAEHLQVQKIKDLRQKSKQYTQNNLSIQGFIPDKKQRSSNLYFEQSVQRQNKQATGIYMRSTKKQKQKTQTKTKTSSFNTTVNSQVFDLSNPNYSSGSRQNKKQQIQFTITGLNK